MRQKLAQRISAWLLIHIRVMMLHVARPRLLYSCWRKQIDKVAYLGPVFVALVQAGIRFW